METAEGRSRFFPEPKSVLGVMRTPVPTVQATDSLRKAINLLRTAAGRHLPILKGDELIGILSGCGVQLIKYPFLHRVIERGDHEALDRVRIQEVIAGNPVSIGPYHSVVEAAQMLAERDVCALPVVDGRRVVGMVSERELVPALVALIKEFEARIECLEGEGGE